MSAPAGVEDVEVLKRLRAALPYVGLNGWSLGVEVLDRVIDALAPQPAATRVRCGDERYELDAYLWRRESTQEWVLELSGAINDTSFTNRFPVPLSYAPEEAVSLPNYVEQPAAVDEAMVKRALEAQKSWPCPERGTASRGMSEAQMRFILSLALAGQQHGGTPE